ncbi:malonyl-CoA decarboxylase-domain-containing protein [Absidia repens]|uniref:Malonyl-CoA decarboxylase-domain-containing protein n=1 Tax=Absidia repens TaxID=90262 RepID=A0A1X2ID65_9FUNG|nr:malonyl-CoA decarboxylase-domain-containing protein [Absidia repens]
MQKYFVQNRLFTSLLRSRYYSSYSISHNLQTKINTTSTDHHRSPKPVSSTYWSLLQDTPCDFRFTAESSKLAIKDAKFMQRLFAHTTTTPSSNSSSTLISHCHDLYRTLDMPSQIVFLRYLNDYYPQQCLRHFFRQLYQLPGGVKRLVDLRASLLAILRYYPCEQPNLSPLEASLKSNIKRWLIASNNPSSRLSIERITWKSSSPEVVEKLCRYEAVHAVTSLKDIKRRLAPDRRIYALFARKLPKEPLVFVHVAFVPELSNSIQTILQPSLITTPHYNNNNDDSNSLSPKYRYAICYSITTQQGLGGMHLGNYLIRNVVGQLQQSYPQLHTFATLSPIPGFRSWLTDQMSKDPSLLLQLETASGCGRYHPWDQNISNIPKDNPLATTLSRLCARYLLEEKRSNNGALDPVANFHLRNGACVHQLHWMGDTSAKGINESFGLMVNYNYIPSRLDELHQQYVDHGTIFISEQSNAVSPSWLSERLGPNVISLV